MDTADAVGALGAVGSPDDAGLTIRPARQAELERVGELTAAAYLADSLVPADSDYVDHLRDAASRVEHATLLVAVEAAGLVVGTVTYCGYGTEYAEVSAPGEAEIRMLAVDPAARGRGVGIALVEACLDRARRAGCLALVLSTQPTMRAARRIYEHAGFVRVPELDWTPVPGVDLEVLRRVL